jgi:hypothetical protein
MTSTAWHALNTTSVHGEADDRRIDEWELEASRRMLANLRELLIGQPILDLIADQLSEHERRMKKYVEESNGQFSECKVVLRATGVTLKEFVANTQQQMGVLFSNDLAAKREWKINLLFPMHPEHYHFFDHAFGGVETMGGLPIVDYLERTEEGPEWIMKLRDPAYPMQIMAKTHGGDGTPHFWTLQQFRECEGGLEAVLRVFYPAACPPSYVEEHAQHFAIEYRNILRLSAAGRGGNA